MSNNNLYPAVVGPIVEEMLRHGPMTREQVRARATCGDKHKNTAIAGWVKYGWMVKLSDGRLGPGPKSASLSTRRHAKIPMRDETAIDGSDQHYAVTQLAHGTLFESEIADLLDVSPYRAHLVVRKLRDLGYIRKMLNGPWELVRRAGAAE